MELARGMDQAQKRDRNLGLTTDGVLQQAKLLSEFRPSGAN